MIGRVKGPGYRFSAHDTNEFSDDEIAQGAALVARRDEEIWSDDPPVPIRTLIAALRARSQRIRRWEFRAWAADGALVGHAHCSIDPDHDDNPDLLPVEVFVDPAHRRNGVGTELVERLGELAAAEGRTRLTSWSTSRTPAGAGFAAACGAREVLHGHINHLSVPTIDRAMLERWVSDGPSRAPGYQLIGWDGPTPDEYLVAFADLYFVMNDAPLDDLETNDSTFSPEQLRGAGGGDESERGGALDIGGAIRGRHARGLAQRELEGVLPRGAERRGHRGTTRAPGARARASG